MQPTRPDAIDLRILATLQQRARAANTEIADHANLSPASALRRTQALERAGYIRGYHAKLDAPKLGFGVTAYLCVRLTSQTKSHVAEFEARMAELPIVRECYALSGTTDFLVKCTAARASDLERFIRETLTTMANVEGVRSAFVVRTSKELPGVPISIWRQNRLTPAR